MFDAFLQVFVLFNYMFNWSFTSYTLLVFMFSYGCVLATHSGWINRLRLLLLFASFSTFGIWAYFFSDVGDTFKTGVISVVVMTILASIYGIPKYSKYSLLIVTII